MRTKAARKHAPITRLQGILPVKRIHCVRKVISMKRAHGAKAQFTIAIMLMMTSLFAR